MALSPHEGRRGLLWTSVCEHRALLPELRQQITRAQEHEDETWWRHLVTRRDRLEDQLTDLERQLWALDPAWSTDVLGRFYATHQDETPDPSRRVR
jgi:hypothetical protein